MIRKGKFLYPVLLMLYTALCASSSEPKVPMLRHVFDIHAECDKARDIGAIPGGKRVIIPLSGGYVDGDINASILPGGADYQVIDSVSCRVEYNAIYTLLTSDSIMINVKNTGISVPTDKDQYFMTSPTFEAPVNSRYNWLNNHIFICRPIGFSNGMANFRVWVAE